MHGAIIGSTICQGGERVDKVTWELRKPQPLAALGVRVRDIQKKWQVGAMPSQKGALRLLSGLPMAKVWHSETQKFP